MVDQFRVRPAEFARETRAQEALPKWAQSIYTPSKLVLEGNSTSDDVRQMVRSLLEDRFQFAANIEKREGQVYAHVAAKAGSGPKPDPEGTPCARSWSQVDEKKYPLLNPSYKAVPVHCGVFNRELSHSGERRLEMLNVTMQQFAKSLGLGPPLFVVDRTGLAGARRRSTER